MNKGIEGSAILRKYYKYLNSAAALLAGGGLRQYNSHKEKGAAAPSFLREINGLEKMEPIKKNTAAIFSYKRNNWRRK